VERTSDATTKDFLTQKMALEEVINPILQKLNEPRKYMFILLCNFPTVKSLIDVNNVQV
jgi:hypothetical protein